MCICLPELLAVPSQSALGVCWVAPKCYCSLGFWLGTSYHVTIYTSLGDPSHLFPGLYHLFKLMTPKYLPLSDLSSDFQTFISASYLIFTI